MVMVRRIASHLALGLAGVVAALVIFELGVRVVNHWIPYFYCYDRYRGWGLRPNVQGWYRREGKSFVSINSDGFRGPEFTKAKPPDTVRIAVLGDSYTQAIQVPYDKTFCAVAERQLRRCTSFSGRRVQVLDFGVDGYGTEQEAITLDRQAFAYAPDIVVLAAFLGNDIRNNSVVLEGNQCRPFVVIRGGKLVPAGPFDDSRAFRLWCMARFDYRDAALPALFKNAWQILTAERRIPTPASPVEAAINYNIYKPPADRAWRHAWHVTEALIAAMHDDVSRHGARFLAVTLDTGIQVWPNPRVRENFMKHRGLTDLFYPDKRIQQLGKRMGFEVLTLAPELQQYAQAHHVFLHGFSNTPMGFGHWNELGHRLAGELIAQRICRMENGQMTGAPAANAQ